MRLSAKLQCRDGACPVSTPNSQPGCDHPASCSFKPDAASVQIPVDERIFVKSQVMSQFVQVRPAHLRSVVIAVVAAAAGGKQAPAILGTAAVAAGTCGVVGGLVRGKRMLRTLGSKPGGKA